MTAIYLEHLLADPLVSNEPHKFYMHHHIPSV